MTPDPRGEDVEATPDLLGYCLTRPGAWRDEPWEGDVVAKVGDRILAFLGSRDGVGLKLGRNRDEADEWIRRYPQDALVSAYLGRHGWDVLHVEGRIPADESREATDEPYDRVVSGLPRSRRPARAGTTRGTPATVKQSRDRPRRGVSPTRWPRQHGPGRTTLSQVPGAPVRLGRERPPTNGLPLPPKGLVQP